MKAAHLRMQCNLPSYFLGFRKPSRELLPIFSPIQPNVFCFFLILYFGPKKTPAKAGQGWQIRRGSKQGLQLLAAPQNTNAYRPDLPGSVHNWRIRSCSEPCCSNWCHKASATALVLIYGSPDSQMESRHDFLSRKLPASSWDVLKSGLGKCWSEHFPAWASPCRATMGMESSYTGIWLPLWCGK